MIKYERTTLLGTRPFSKSTVQLECCLSKTSWSDTQILMQAFLHMYLLSFYQYKLMSSSDTALGVRMPRSVKSRERREAGV
jgi:hypothetical protein